MEIIMSYIFSHLVEAIVLWMSMSQMYEHRYKQWVTGIDCYHDRTCCNVWRVSDGKYIFYYGN